MFEEVLGAGALEGAPAAAARPVAVDQRVVQVQHQRPHMPVRTSRGDSWKLLSELGVPYKTSRVASVKSSIP